jgi:hypothetical protein
MGAPSELRDAARTAFGPSDVLEYRYSAEQDSEDEDERVEAAWPERAIKRWRDEQMAGGARTDKKRTRIEHKEGGAWAARKKRKEQRALGVDTSRKASSNAAE